jgi:putative Mn2+ efflux pump MntP
MFSFETTLMGVALALDAAVVSFAVGIMNLELPIHHKLLRGLFICLLFGFFQSLMIWFGSVAGYYLSFSSLGHFFQLIVSLIFFILGFKVLQESLDNNNGPLIWGIMALFVMALATSLDAFGAGISLGSLPHTLFTAFEIGFITFVMCLLFYSGSFFLKSLPSNWLLSFAAVIFFYLGGQILFVHYF